MEQPSASSVRMLFHIASRAWMSRPTVGSSRNSTFGPPADRHCELRLPFLAAGKFAVRAIRELRDAGAPQRLVDFERVVVVARGERDELARAQLLRHLHVLHHHAEPAALHDVLRMHRRAASRRLRPAR